MDIESKITNYLNENIEYKIDVKIAKTLESLKKDINIIEKDLNKVSDNKKANKIKKDLNSILGNFKKVYDSWNKK